MSIKLKDEYRKQQGKNYLYRFHININMFSLNSEDSLGILKLQIKHINGDNGDSATLTLIDWRESKRCHVVRNPIAEDKLDFAVQLDEIGVMKLTWNGQRVTLDCQTKLWTEVRQVEVSLMNLIDQTNSEAQAPEELFDIHFLVYHLPRGLC